MSPRTLAELVHRDAPLIQADQPIGAAVRLLLDAELPALPVFDALERFVGIFGEREFITALFPGYVGSLGYAAFVPKSIDAAWRSAKAAATSPCPST